MFEAEEDACYERCLMCYEQGNQKFLFSVIQYYS